MSLATATSLRAAPPAAPAAPGRVVVAEGQLPSAYGAPESFSRGRFAPLTAGYVLPPFSVYAGVDYEIDSPREGRPQHLFTQELEVGLPHRLGVAIENSFSAFRGEVEESTINLEGRYALADWNKIPLNPTVFFEYKFGIGHIVGAEAEEEGEKLVEIEKMQDAARAHNRRRPHAPKRAAEDAADADADQDAEKEAEGEGGSERLPDAVEFRLLLSQDFAHRVEWAMNLFFEQEVGGDRGREWGFAQSLATPVLLAGERLKLGIEMQYRNETRRGRRGDPEQAFVIGPSAAVKLTRNARFDLSTLFGATEEAPRVQVFAIFSYVFGSGGDSNEAEAPASTRNR